MGKLTNNNTLTIDTGKFTGRAPKDRFIVKDKITSNSVDWGNINQAIEPVNNKKLKNGLSLQNKKKIKRYRSNT